MLKRINNSNAKIKRSIKLSSVFKEKKCRLRLENLTRWSSSYLMLESVKRAFDRGALTNFETEEEIYFPHDLNKIELYLKILKPAYVLSLNFQYNVSSICDVRLGVIRLMDTWRRMQVQGEYKNLCLLLTMNVKHKFELEYNSVIYKVLKI